MIDHGTDDWRVSVTQKGCSKVLLELLICSVCPLPGTTTFSWPFLSIPEDSTTYVPVSVPVDVLLSLPMFLRFYLLGRVLVHHSRSFKDAATRSIAAMNRISVDFKFVCKSAMSDSPISVILTFTISFWLLMSWMLTQCERYLPPANLTDTTPPPSYFFYMNSLWLVVITFMSVGYGDVVPHTYCGRVVAISTGVVGIGVASALVAVISRKLDLTRAEKHVNAFLADTKCAKELKHSAARVLQEMWFIYKYRVLVHAHSKDEMKVRLHQRRFLAAITEFRRNKWEQRKLAEQTNNLVDITKIQGDLQDAVHDMQVVQQDLVDQLQDISQKVDSIFNAICRGSQLHKSASNLSPSNPTSPLNLRRAGSQESDCLLEYHSTV